MDAKMKKVIASETNVYSKRFAAKLDARMERILEDAENLVKSYFPAKQVSASLTKLQAALVAEGINCVFDKTVTKEAIASTADSDISEKECNEAVRYIANAVVDETEDTLEACDKAIKALAKKHYPKNRISTARKMRKSVAEIMNKQGLHFDFDGSEKKN